MAQPPTPSARRHPIARAAGWVGLILHLPTLALYLSSGLLAPGWAVAGLLVVWLALLILALRWFRIRPWPVLAVPLLDLLIWWGVLSAGEAFLGWTG